MELKKKLVELIEEARRDYVENYDEKYRGLDLNFTTLLEMKLGISRDAVLELNYLANKEKGRIKDGKQ